MKNSGLSLIELLVAIAIVGILSAIAVPVTGSYLSQGKMTTAQADLMLLSLRYENRYQRVLAYPAAAASDTAGLQSLMSGWSPASASEDFDFSSENASNTSYTLKATGKKSRYSGCVITLTHDGTKSISNCASMAADSKWL